VYHFFCLFLALLLLIFKYLQRFPQKNTFFALSCKIRKNKLKKEKFNYYFSNFFSYHFF